MAKPDRTPPAVPRTTIADVADTDLAGARQDLARGMHPFYGTPLAMAWSAAHTHDWPMPATVEYPTPHDNAVAIAHLCREIAALKGVKLPTKYGDDPGDDGTPPDAA